jgi:hypothetical protein
MPSTIPSNHDGMTLSQAALVAGITYVLNPVSYAEASIFPKLVIPGNIDQTFLNPRLKIPQPAPHASPAT